MDDRRKLASLPVSTQHGEPHRVALYVGPRAISRLSSGSVFGLAHCPARCAVITSRMDLSMHSSGGIGGVTFFVNIYQPRNAGCSVFHSSAFSTITLDSVSVSVEELRDRDKSDAGVSHPPCIRRVRPYRRTTMGYFPVGGFGDYRVRVRSSPSGEGKRRIFCSYAPSRGACARYR